MLRGNLGFEKHVSKFVMSENRNGHRTGNVVGKNEGERVPLMKRKFRILGRIRRVYGDRILCVVNGRKGISFDIAIVVHEIETEGRPTHWRRR